MTPESCGMTTELLIAEQEKARAVLPEHVVVYVEHCCGTEHPHSYLIPVLHKVQDHFGYLAQEHMDAVSTLMQIPAAKVTGVASFYHYFTFTPRGEHQISLCMGTACFVKGAGEVLDKLKDLLGIEVGETTPDGLFSIDVARCVGACALGAGDDRRREGVRRGQARSGGQDLGPIRLCPQAGEGGGGGEGRRGKLQLEPTAGGGRSRESARPTAHVQTRLLVSPRRRRTSL